MKKNDIKNKEWVFKERLENKLFAQGMIIKRIEWLETEQHRISGIFYFPEEEVSFDLQHWIRAYIANDASLECFVQYITKWHEIGEQIKEISNVIFEKNKMEITISLRSFGGFSYSAPRSTIFACPESILNERPQFVKEKEVESYIATCLLHETGHHLQALSTNLLPKRFQLLQLVEKNQIKKEDFLAAFITQTLEIEYDAWERAEKIVPPFSIDPSFLKRLRDFALSSYHHHLHHQAEQFHALFSKCV